MLLTRPVSILTSSGAVARASGEPFDAERVKLFGVLIETAENEVEEVKEILTDKMKHAANLKVSLEVDAKTGASWFDAK